ncbi:hypothetical protein D6C80_09267 [Aureobasidium pullulans]|nr:hypothetical protein D6C80_09267 [Aureobasidium pullulans]
MNRPCYRNWTSSVIHDEDVRLLQKCHIELVVHLFHGLNAPWPFQSLSVVAPPGVAVVNEDNLESCTRNVTYFMRETHNVQEGLGHAPASTPVDVQCLHRLYNGLANALPRDLATPAALQNQPPPLGAAIVPDIAPDETFEAIIQGMNESRATDTDIMKLVFHWTTLTLHKEMWRKDVMESVTTDGVLSRGGFRAREETGLKRFRLKP